MTDVIDYIQPVGSTRDCQRRRFRESTYVECADIIRTCFNIIHNNVDFDAPNTKEGIAFIKLNFFAIFDAGRCFIPLTVWKDIARSVIGLSGGKRRLRTANPSFLYQLERTDRRTVQGTALRDLVIARFLEGLGNA